MGKIHCLIVDDEPISRDIIQTYCNHLPALQVLGTCRNALEAKEFLRKETIHLIFLDINMPILDGIAFLKTLKHPPQVIFTTAYKEYAVDAFDLAACDYLLKPFSLERFIVAVDKAMERMAVLPEKNNQTSPQQIFLKSDGKIFHLELDQILFAEAHGNYTKITTTRGTLLPGMTFTHLTEMLPGTVFLRVHRSFLLNKQKITHIEGNRVFIQHHEIPIGNNFKEAFLRALGLGS